MSPFAVSERPTNWSTYPVPPTPSPSALPSPRDAMHLIKDPWIAGPPQPAPCSLGAKPGEPLTPRVHDAVDGAATTARKPAHPTGPLKMRMKGPIIKASATGVARLPVGAPWPAAGDDGASFKGITRDRKDGKWRVRINFHRKRCYLGKYDTARLAARVYDRAAVLLQGPKACTNFGIEAALADTRCPLSPAVQAQLADAGRCMAEYARSPPTATISGSEPPPPDTPLATPPTLCTPRCELPAPLPPPPGTLASEAVAADPAADASAPLPQLVAPGPVSPTVAPAPVSPTVTPAPFWPTLAPAPVSVDAPLDADAMDLEHALAFLVQEECASDWGGLPADLTGALDVLLDMMQSS